MCNSDSYEKFEKWAATVPYTMRNPLYHWTHLELARVFGINELLNPSTAKAIYDECTAKLQTEEYRGQALMRRFDVKVVCTTDDPADSLEYHKQIQDNPFGTKVLPTWRPDKAMVVEKPEQYIAYIKKLSAAAGMEINNYQDLLDALRKRQGFFHEMGCRISDHGFPVAQQKIVIFSNFLSFHPCLSTGWGQFFSCLGKKKYPP